MSLNFLAVHIRVKSVQYVRNYVAMHMNQINSDSDEGKHLHLQRKQQFDTEL